MVARFLSPAPRPTIARRGFPIVITLAACNPSALVPEDCRVTPVWRVVIDQPWPLHRSPHRMDARQECLRFRAPPPLVQVSAVALISLTLALLTMTLAAAAIDSAIWASR